MMSKEKLDKWHTALEWTYAIVGKVGSSVVLAQFILFLGVYFGKQIDGVSVEQFETLMLMQCLITLMTLTAAWALNYFMHLKFFQDYVQEMDDNDKNP